MLPLGAGEALGIIEFLQMTIFIFIFILFYFFIFFIFCVVALAALSKWLTVLVI